jgi:hypothetical protein
MLAGVMLLVMSLAAGIAQGRQLEMATCPGFQAVLRVSPATVKSGSELRFSLVLKNVSVKPVRLLDIRAGHRPDLADSYYEVQFERGRRAAALPHAISDPGPISATDFFTLSPGSEVEVTPSTKHRSANCGRGSTPRTFASARIR